jgi:hypothetical protein
MANGLLLHEQFHRVKNHGNDIPKDIFEELGLAIAVSGIQFRNGARMDARVNREQSISKARLSRPLKRLANLTSVT